MRAVSAAFPRPVRALPGAAVRGWVADWRDLACRPAALLWAGLVRVAVLQHVTWSVNSLCHVFGSRPFATRRYDRATNLWPLALLSFGESWHNMHHSDPACARHGADRGQIDISAEVIRMFERLGWVTRCGGLPLPGLTAAAAAPRQGEPEPVLQPGEPRTGRAAASRLSPLAARR